ncbi:multiubiquitin domain-containing protein [Paraburkholderia sp. XV]|uniref:multiubiquitin domain-containing protein n=1 Tax=Paraburkholderia sp. XV TaxID=2831520 RepID=UPI001CD481FF|nr:multiubiquitin domain-containing protein [Paraburkholderia sp. XV]
MNHPNEGIAVEQHRAHPDHGGVEILVSGLDFEFRSAYLASTAATGREIASAAHVASVEDASVLLFGEDGILEDVGLDRVLEIQSGARFIVVDADASYRIRINGNRFDWPCRVISGAQVRALGEIPHEQSLFLERTDAADREVGRRELIDLAMPGIEVFYSREATWLLNVQGVRLALHVPEITVRQAMIDAGFDVTQGWHIYLKVKGEQKREVQLDTVIDMRTPGVEKLRLTPKDVSNGEAQAELRTDFALLEIDETFLDAHFVNWETVKDGERRWLLIQGYPMPDGYSAARVTLAIEVPPTYPAAQLDMFYLCPIVELESKAPIPNTEARVTIGQQEFQRWSRHRGNAAPWLPATDNVITHLALVESSLRREVGA